MSWFYLWIVAIPALLWDRLVRAYLLVIAAMAILCLLNVGLWLLAGLAGLPLP